jgi:hypothetical protein
MEITNQFGRYADGGCKVQAAWAGIPWGGTIAESSLGDCRLNTDCTALGTREWRGSKTILAPDPAIVCVSSH